MTQNTVWWSKLDASFKPVVALEDILTVKNTKRSPIPKCQDLNVESKRITTCNNQCLAEENQNNSMIPSKLNLIRTPLNVSDTQNNYEHESNRPKCDICGKVFSSKRVKEKHKLRVSCTFGFSCKICKKSFRSRNFLRIHEERTHDVVRKKKLKCDICGTYFANITSIEEHMDGTHSNSRKYSCSTCGKTYKTKRTLRNHLQLHTTKKPYKCSFEGCEQYFRSTSTRNHHTRIHFEQKPYDCGINGCNYRNVRAYRLRDHKIKVHSIFTNEYSCKICSEKFNEKFQLKDHIFAQHSQ